MSASCSNTESKSLSKWQETRLPCQWTPVTNHSISIARQSSAQQCWLVLAYNIPVSRPTWQCNGLRSGDFNISKFILKSESRFNYMFTLKNAHLSSNSYNFWMQECSQIFQWNLQNMWPGSSSVSTVNLVKKFATIPDISNYSQGFTFCRSTKSTVGRVAELLTSRTTKLLDGNYLHSSTISRAVAELRLVILFMRNCWGLGEFKPQFMSIQNLIFEWKSAYSRESLHGSFKRGLRHSATVSDWKTMHNFKHFDMWPLKQLSKHWCRRLCH